MPRPNNNERLVMVSGGAGGVGRCATQLFSAAGATVGIMDIQVEAGNRLLDEAATGNRRLRFYKTDVSDPEQVRDAISQFVDEFGGIDVLINHAGTVVVKPFLQTETQDWDRMWQINVMSMVHTCQAVIPSMIERGGGAIVNTASVSGLTASALEAAYCVSKGACIQLTRSIAVEFRNQNIRCNAVCPALIRTNHGTREAEQLVALGQSWTDADVARMQGRICEPDEVARVMFFLAGTDASFINGEMVVIDNAQLATT